MRSTTESAFNVTTTEISTEEQSVLSSIFSSFATVFFFFLFSCFIINFFKDCCSGNSICECLRETSSSCYSCIRNVFRDLCGRVGVSCRSCFSDLCDRVHSTELPSCSKCHFLECLSESSTEQQTNQQNEVEATSDAFVDLTNVVDHTTPVSLSTSEPTAPPLEPQSSPLAPPPSYESAMANHEYIAPPDIDDTVPPPSYQEVIRSGL